MADRWDAHERYLHLLKICLTRYGLEGDFEYRPYKTHRRGLDARLRRAVQRWLRGRGLELVERRAVDLEARRVGRDWPTSAETMIGLERLENLQMCVETILRDDVPGDLIETGVWRGGASIFMRALLAVHGDSDRIVWLADSFEGLPPPDPAYPSDTGWDLSIFEELRVSLEDVQANFERYGLLDDQVRFLEGWFKDTLPTAPIERLALLRLDGDLYESTIQALDALYHKLSPGGFVIVDDYDAVSGSKDAVHDFRKREGIEAPLERIDWASVYWRRPLTSAA